MRPATVRSIGLALGIVVASACAQPPVQRQAAREPSERADALVAEIDFRPERRTVGAGTIRNEYTARGVVDLRSPDGDDVVLVVDASPAVIADLAVGDEVRFSRADGRGAVETGVIGSLPEPDSAAPQRVLIHSPFLSAGSDEVPPGTRFAVTLLGQPLEGATTVPNAAVYQERDQAFLIVESADGGRRRRDVTVVARTATTSAVDGDVVPGEVVILR